MANITAKKIDELPAALSLQDSNLFPVYQNGTAKSLSGAQLKQFVKDNTPTSDPAALYYDLDLTSIVVIKRSDDGRTPVDESFDITSIVDVEALIAAVKEGKIVRIFFKESSYSQYVYTTLMTDVLTHNDIYADKLVHLVTSCWDAYTEKNRADIVITGEHIGEGNPSVTLYYMPHDNSDDQPAASTVDFSAWEENKFTVTTDDKELDGEVEFDAQNRPTTIKLNERTLALVWPEVK